MWFLIYKRIQLKDLIVAMPDLQSKCDMYYSYKCILKLIVLRRYEKFKKVKFIEQYI